jgi:multidrug efflux pump subunit AcrA (membrane-fusion protein)
VEQLQMLKQQQDQLQRQQEQELKVKQDQVNHQLQQQQIQEQQRRLMLQQEEEERQRQLQQEQQIKQQQAQQPKKVNYFAIASEFDKISVSSWMNDPVFREKLNDSAQYFDLFDHPEAEWSSSEFIRKEHHRRKRERKRIGASVISGRARDASESETLLVGRTGEKKYVRYNPNPN